MAKDSVKKMEKELKVIKETDIPEVDEIALTEADIDDAPKGTKKKKKMEIEDLPGVGPATADKLRFANYRDIMSIATAPTSALMDATGLGEGVCAKISIAAKALCDMKYVTGIEMEKRTSNRMFLDTGSKAFNEMLGGGFATGVINEVHGTWGSSKTQVAHTMCVLATQIEPDAVAVYIDVENCFKPQRIREIAKARGLNPDEVLSRIIWARAYSFDHQILLVEKLQELAEEGKNIKLVVVDSIIAHARTELVGRGTLNERQNRLGAHLNTLEKLAEVHNFCALVTNQVMSNPGQLFGDPIQPVGGNILGHRVKTRVYLRKGKKGSRVAKLVDSIYLPDGECAYLVTDKGIEDI